MVQPLFRCDIDFRILRCQAIGGPRHHVYIFQTFFVFLRLNVVTCDCACGLPSSPNFVTLFHCGFAQCVHSESSPDSSTGFGGQSGVVRGAVDRRLPVIDWPPTRPPYPPTMVTILISGQIPGTQLEMTWQCGLGPRSTTPAVSCTVVQSGENSAPPCPTGALAGNASTACRGAGASQSMSVLHIHRRGPEATTCHCKSAPGAGAAKQPLGEKLWCKSLLALPI